MDVKKINEYFKDLEKNEGYSGSVLILKGNDVVVKESFGSSNRTFDIPNTISTKYRIASISKSITAMAILILEDQGKLKLENTLDVFLPELTDGDKITIYQLITHTSGIYNIDNDPAYQQLKCGNHTIDDIYNTFKNKPVDFKLGERFEYSNYGYILLSLIIERLSGATYEQFIKENIFSKLSMKDSGLFKNEEILKGMANGYTKENEKIINSEIEKLSYYGAGGLYSTVEDIYHFSKALKEVSLLSDRYKEKIFNRHEFVEGEFYYGFGFMLYKPDHQHIEFIYQDGGIAGFRSIYMIYPKLDITIILLNNCDYIRIEKIIDGIEPQIK